MAAEQLTLVWSSDIVRDGDGVVRLVARKPLSHMSRKRAAEQWQAAEGFVGFRQLGKSGWLAFIGLAHL